jgi:electron transfer flavoprotein alpha subunit
MAVSKIWVLAEATDGNVATITLEMLAKARELAATVECVYGGPTPRPSPPPSAPTAPPRCTPPATSAAPSPASPSPPPSPPPSRRATVPTPCSSARPRTVATSPGACRCKLDAPVITNIVDLVERDGALVGVEPVFGGTQNVLTRFTTDKTQIFLIRPKSFAAEESGGGAAAVAALSVPDTRCRPARRRS